MCQKYNVQAVALAPAVLTLSALRDGIERLRQRPLATAVAGPLAVALAAAAIDGGTVAHPYLLADNRQAGGTVPNNQIAAGPLDALLTGSST